MSLHPSVFVHESSFIDENVSIGAHTKIWHFCHILAHTTIGESCSFGQNCSVGAKVSIGNGCRIQNNVSIYEGVTCEDEVFIGPSVVFSNILNPRAFLNRKDQFLPTLLKKGCSIGANATIICGNTIGRYALIGAGAVITRSVPDYALVVGNPAKQIGWVDKHGERLIFKNNIAHSKAENCDYYLTDIGVIAQND